MLGDWVLTKWLRMIALLSTLVLAAAAPVAILALLPSLSSADRPSPTSRPHPFGHTEGYGNEKVLDFFYPQQFYCTVERVRLARRRLSYAGM